MSNKVAKFHKVSFEQYLEDVMGDNVDLSEIYLNCIQEQYDNITLPKRSTVGSAGYDFVSPISFELNPGYSIKIPTGIKCYIEDDWVLKLYPRSGLGFKYQVGLANTVGIIDRDYFFAKNEGHIAVKLVNNGEKVLSVNAGDKIVQGVFVPFGITIDDDADGERTGGFGSTGK
ncbi:MAG: deoxyuridine 5'-triphosphate nucleotidohydrolase [Bacilli bacterium]|nr:deoxyuridine 5'-triphosphate nucleotidohydrolase [Bacilli bacterium]